MTYDSKPDTLAHIGRVMTLLRECQDNLLRRASIHDTSKLQSVEKPIFDRVTPRLKDLTYGSDEYKASLAEMKPALDHHYAANRHHPEHYPDGVNGMSLFDLVEMVMDWKAAGERHADGDIWKSIKHNAGRFNLSDQLVRIIENTAREMGW